MKLKSGLGFFCSGLLIFSAAAHAFLGWPPLHVELMAHHVDGDLINALKIGWYFGSVSMLAFGIIVLWFALKIIRKETVSLAPILIIAAGYLGFGCVAFIKNNFNPHFLIFIVTGVLLVWFALVNAPR